MANFVIVFCCLAITSITAAPASNEQLDKATVNDVAVNTVEDNASRQVELLPQPASSSASTVEISGITTGAETPATPAVENPPFKPQRAGSMFARFIDDIFQIPITVLQNVARLITSPFSQARRNPEVLAPVS